VNVFVVMIWGIFVKFNKNHNAHGLLDFLIILLNKKVYPLKLYVALLDKCF
jgi:hypothetical protein